MIELEKTYLAKYLPESLKDCKHKEVHDIYFPASSVHPNLRVRKNGDKYEITKKVRINDNDASEQEEFTIKLTEEEFKALSKVEGKVVRKIRYELDISGRTAEVDVFQDDLAGLVLVDFEFETVEDKDKFAMPEFCLADVTQETFLAGGMLCGKKYSDIEKSLEKHNYRRLSF